MEKRLELNRLLDFYGPLLTENRRRIAEMYFEDDLSLSEIAEQSGVTRQGVYDAIKNAERQLRRFEEKLGLAGRYGAVERGVDAVRALLKENRPREALKALDQIEW